MYRGTSEDLLGIVIWNIWLFVASSYTIKSPIIYKSLQNHTERVIEIFLISFPSVHLLASIWCLVAECYRGVTIKKGVYFLSIIYLFITDTNIAPSIYAELYTFIIQLIENIIAIISICWRQFMFWGFCLQQMSPAAKDVTVIIQAMLSPSIAVRLLPHDQVPQHHRAL